MEFLLREEGYPVLAAGTRAEALRLARSHAGELAVAIVDQSLPDGTGIALARELRAIQAGVCLVLTSGAPVEGVSADIRFLQKPFEMDALIGMLEGAAVAVDR
jgi:DNA-binding response OmpR family regulator